MLMSGMLCRPQLLPKLQPLLLPQWHMTLRLPLQVRCLLHSFCACSSDLQDTQWSLIANTLRHLVIAIGSAARQKTGSTLLFNESDDLA